jgi:hypothetical protein
VEEWAPPGATDAAVREWMAALGLEVTSTRYDFDGETYAWRHDILGGSPTLRISRVILEDQPAAALLDVLERLGVGDILKAHGRTFWLRAKAVKSY